MKHLIDIFDLSVAELDALRVTSEKILHSTLRNVKAKNLPRFSSSPPPVPA